MEVNAPYELEQISTKVLDEVNAWVWALEGLSGGKQIDKVVIDPRRRQILFIFEKSIKKELGSILHTLKLIVPAWLITTKGTNILVFNNQLPVPEPF